MNNIEKSHLEKLMFAIHIDNESNVIEFYRKLINHRELTGNRNTTYLEKANEAYAGYMVKKYGLKKPGVKDADDLGWLK